jgi:hypothetical protein
MIYNHIGDDFKYEYSNTGWWFQPTPQKYMSSSVGMMTFPIYGKMFQTTNQNIMIGQYDLG